MCAVADRWQAPGCLQAVLAGLAAADASALTAAHVGAILTTLPSSLHTSPAYEKLKAMCAARLVQLFGNVFKVITDGGLRGSFCALPSPAVLLWGGQDQLSVDSENSVVVALTLWHDSQPNDSCSPQFLKDLTACVRVQHLTSSFRLGVLPQLAWFSLGTELMVKLNIALSQSPCAPLPQYLVKHCPAWGLGVRCGSSNKSRAAAQGQAGKSTLVWRVPQSELQESWWGEGATRKGMLLQSRKQYYAGVYWSLQLEMETKKSIRLSWIVHDNVEGCPAPPVTVYASAIYFKPNITAPDHIGKRAAWETGKARGWTIIPGPVMDISQLSEYLRDGHWVLRAVLSDWD